MNVKVFLLVIGFSLISFMLAAQGVPVFGGFPQQVEWFKFEGNWTPDKTVYYEYGFVGEVLTVKSEETRINNVPVSRMVYQVNDQAYPTVNLYQAYSNGTWTDVYRIVYEWDNQDPENLLMNRYMYQVFQNNEWVIQYGTQYQYEFFNNGQRRREIMSNYNMLTGNWDLSTRTRTSFDAWGRNIGDTTEVFRDGDWEFSMSEVNYYKQTDQVNEPDSTISYSWVPANEVWALSWWKPVNRYIYIREPRSTFWTLDKWDDIALEWYTTSRHQYQWGENWNMTLNLHESFKDEWWETGEWKIYSGQRWTLTWENSLPVERIAENYVLPTETEGGHWSLSTREVFSNFLDIPVSNKEIISSKTDASVFPIPFSNKLSVSIPESEESIIIEIIDLSGRVMIIKEIPSNENQFQIETSALPKGPCLLLIRNRNLPVQTIKMIKN